MNKTIYDQIHDSIGKYDLQVIRCHLVIEEQLNKIIKLLANNSRYFFKQQINFSTKVAVVRSFDSSGNAKIWDLIVLFNKLRNHIAHDLPYDRDKRKIDVIMNHPEIKNFIETLPEDITKSLDVPTQEHLNLTLALMYIFGFLQGRIEYLNGKKKI